MFLTDTEHSDMFEYLNNNLEFYPKEMTQVTVRGNKYNIARDQVAYGEKGLSYSFSGTNIPAINWNKKGKIEKIIRTIRDKVNKITGKNYNFVLINRYNNGKEYIGYHKDKTNDLVNNPDIIGVNLGATRIMGFQHDNKQMVKINLKGGSMVIIKNPTNKFWKHSILKTTQQVGPRISLTFRIMK
jgi:alpha-ketoglutarate-dependent dioxygenase alkB family protein 2